jgi:hypothetical protein
LLSGYLWATLSITELITDRIIAFLINRSWQVAGENGNFLQLSPPQEISLPENYQLYIPLSSDRSDSDAFIDNLLDTIAGFYFLTKDDLWIIVKKENTILKVTIYDEQTEEGKIALTRFEGLIERIKTILSDTASFVIDRSMTSTRVPEEVSRYLNLCNFLQTEKGSFVAKIQLPSKELIKDRELFDREEIFSEQINRKLSEILHFVNEDILEGTVDTSEKYLLENESRINIKLLKDLESFYDRADVKNIDFSFHNIDDSRIITSREITKQKLSKLTQFVEQVESHTLEIGMLTLQGRITTLKSKDPDGLRNSVTLTGLYEELPVVATASLSSGHYKEAIEAHKIKQSIVITGLAKRTRTRIRFMEITSFERDG